MIGGRRDDDFVADEQFTLADEDERLPWLESGDEDYEEEGVDTGRIFGFALLALLALAAFVGGIWWFGQRAPDSELVADGSTIRAPAGPYKEKPADPGGKQFEGTGNLAPAVGEGERREGRLAETAPAPTATAKAAAVPEATSTPAASGGVAVQVGAYSNKADAEAGWQRLLAQTDKLAGVSHRVVQGQADIGTVFRLQAMAGDAAAASRLCEALKGDGVACQVKR
ncbi:SPOR domain-containing protein [Tsuneonella sp. HG249]